MALYRNNNSEKDPSRFATEVKLEMIVSSSVGGAGRSLLFSSLIATVPRYASQHERRRNKEERTRDEGKQESVKLEMIVSSSAPTGS